MRWYFEDFLKYPFDPAPRIAGQIEKRMDEIGTGLFKKVFRSNDDVRDLWARVYMNLSNMRIEVVSEVREATTIPWELMRDPKTNIVLALRADAFVRAHYQAVQPARLPQKTSGVIRILLVICRPGGKDDVPFRSVASRLVKGLTEDARKVFQLDVLRPPSFERLGQMLREAHSRKAPYHIVHFDGHGAFLDMEKLFRGSVALTDEETRRRLSEFVEIDRVRFSPQVLYPRQPQPGRHGYLAFENPKGRHNLRLVDGQELGSLLAETRVPVLVLNACRSAHAEAPVAPVAADLADVDLHAQVRSFGSFAQEVMDAGVTGVVAMRYNVYVVTAAQFVADLYGALIQGQSLSHAVNLGRKHLADSPLREVAYEPLPLRDWAVPVVYEAAPIRIFPKTENDQKISINLSEGRATPQRGKLDPNLPHNPDAGFFGRDETLLALDRAFDSQSVVLLHAYAGSGKTATASEFARWYALTGGVKGPVLFTSFEHYTSLARVLDQVELAFRENLEQVGIHWLTLSKEERMSVALQILKQPGVLWIWDNVEPVTGFPRNEDSRWSATEQQELLDFLRMAQGPTVKFLLTSRRQEKEWLGDLPLRIPVPPMLMQERLQLTRALAEKQGRRLTEIEDWRPLLQFTQGNPLTITVLVGQALREGFQTKQQIEAFVEILRKGATRLKDEETEGRTKSLGAALNYGFEHAFNEEEHKQFALLHFFQGFVSVDALILMGDPRIGDLSEFPRLTREEGLALLDRAADIGILTAQGLGNYSVHPDLPRFLRSDFHRYYGGDSTAKATRAFVKTLGWLAGFYFHEYERKGIREAIIMLRQEEQNLLYAWKLACTNRWLDETIEIMQGLRILYTETGQRAAWSRLVTEILPVFIAQESDGPRPGCEQYWSIVTEYRVDTEYDARRWPEAERLQRLLVEYLRDHAEQILEAETQFFDRAPEHSIRLLAFALRQLGMILLEQNKSECLLSLREAISLHQMNREQLAEASVAFALGRAYREISDVRDLSQSKHWYEHSLELSDPADPLARGICLNALGQLSFKRFVDAKAAAEPLDVLSGLLAEAAEYCEKALVEIPSYALTELSVVNNSLGMIYASAGDVDRALSHYRDCLAHEERSRNLYRVGATQTNMALTLAWVGRIAEALEYSRAALRNFETYGDLASEEIGRARSLTQEIERGLYTRPDA